MRPVKDITGQKFNKLTVIGMAPFRDKRGNIMWECRCDCGNTKYCSSYNIVHAQVKSCGCLGRGPAPIDETGKRYGLLTVIGPSEPRKTSRTRGQYWLCRCDCGKEIIAYGGRLRAGDWKSCGCKRKKDYLKFRCEDTT